MKIALVNDINQSAVQALTNHGFCDIKIYDSSLKGDDLIKELQDINILGIRTATQISKDFLNKCKKLMTIGCFCVATNHVDIQESMLNTLDFSSKLTCHS